MLRTGLMLAALAAASPALASAGTTIPDPTDLALFALGVTGLILGHYGARNRPPLD
ncbi:hypothetical protein [Novosphingobium sp.]|uniref:hypothetical protein n=1 Tax=Novosphingobium sp. TaxID=1874826 RepID=UPI0035B45C01